MVLSDNAIHTFKYNRDNTIDIAKGIAIYLVILGHSIQFLGEGGHVLSHFIGKAIYLFHMPAFFLISGYLSFFSFKRSFAELVKKRMLSIFMPMAICSLIVFVCELVFGVVPMPQSFKGLVQVAFSSFKWSYWFLWTLLVCTFYSKLFQLLSCKNDALMLILLPLSCCLAFFIPDSLLLYLQYFRVFYVFFVVGFFLSKYNFLKKIINNRFCVASAICIFSLCYFFAKEDAFVYSLKTMLVYDNSLGYILSHWAFLLVSGLAGFIILINMAKLLFAFGCSTLVNFMSFCGQYSLGIYLIQGILFDGIIRGYDVHLSSTFLYIVASIVMLLVTCMIVNILMKNKVTSRFVLGK